MDNVVNTPPMGVSISLHCWGIPREKTQPEPEGVSGASAHPVICTEHLLCVRWGRGL